MPHNAILYTESCTFITCYPLSFQHTGSEQFLARLPDMRGIAESRADAHALMTATIRNTNAEPDSSYRLW